MRALVLLLPLAACGRSGFDELPADAAPDAAPPVPVLACAAPRFTLDFSTTYLGATATANGYAVIGVDSTGQVTGTAYTFAGDAARTLTRTTAAMPLMANATGRIGAFARGDDVLVEVPYGRPNATGTELLPLDSGLVAHGAATMLDGYLAAAGMAAYNTAGNGAYIGQRMADNEVDGGVVVPGGTLQMPQIPLIPASAGASDATITAAGTKFLLTWAAGGSPREVHAQLFDDQLVPRTAAATVSLGHPYEADVPRAAYAATVNRYLFAWYEKATGGDQIWASLRDGDLAPVGAPIMLSPQGIRPAIAAGNDGFLVVWENGGAPYQLAAARVGFDGTSAALGIPSTGGSPAGWDLVTRAGQPALVWVEASAKSASSLWLDPLCH